MFRFKKNKTVLLATIACFVLAATYITLFNNDNEESNFTPPQLTIEQLLSASDVQQGILDAVAERDEGALEEWQVRIISAAEQIGYQSQQLAFLEGKRGRDYLRFRAKRAIFQQQVEEAYYNGEAFEPIAGRFPEAADLFDKTQQLFAARNATLEAIAEALVAASRDNQEQPLTFAQANAQALLEWQRRLDALPN